MALGEVNQNLNSMESITNNGLTSDLKALQKKENAPDRISKSRKASSERFYQDHNKTLALSQFSLNSNPLIFSIMNTIRNQVQLIGNTGDDPKVTSLDNGKKVARFSMATNEVYRDSNGAKVQDTQWHQIIAWGKTADIIEQYVAKGSELAIQGKLKSHSYTAKDGHTRYVTEVHAEQVLLLGTPNAKAKTSNV